METNFIQKEGVNKIELGIKRIEWNRKMSKPGVNIMEVPHHIQVWECPPLVAEVLQAACLHTQLIQEGVRKPVDGCITWLCVYTA